MKKVFNIISVFILLFSMAGGFFVVSGNETKVLASGGVSTAPQTEKDLVLIKDSFGKVTISGTGTVTITYAYGFSELLVYVTECLELVLVDDEGNDINPKDATACRYFEKDDISGKIKIYHMSGDYNRNEAANGSTPSYASKTFELSKLSVVGTIVRVEAYARFMTYSHNSYANESISKQYEPLYCSHYYTEAGLTCNTEASNEYMGSSSGRIEHFECVEFMRKPVMTNDSDLDGDACLNFNKVDFIEYHDKKFLVYNGPNAGNRFNLARETSQQIGPGPGSEIEDEIKDQYIKVGTPRENEAEANVMAIIEETIIPALITVLLIAAGITIAVQGYRIVKAADEPQERQERVRALRNILIGIGIAILLLAVIRPFITYLEGKLG